MESKGSDYIKQIFEGEEQWRAHEKSQEVSNEEKLRRENSTEERERALAQNRKSLYYRRIPDANIIKQFLKKNSRHGLTGSHNLGNTCFMNSSIQCLSNSTELTAYFLSGEYKQDINKHNKLGLEGKLAESWSDLLNDFWIGDSAVSDARDFKSTMAKRKQQYAGYAQHDSHELITYFLDTMNEDLNKVTKKPYEEISERKEGESDIEASKRWWDLHLRRNDSIITDLFSGQFKSTIRCPECNWVSVTFDPFNSISVPVPTEEQQHGRKIFFIPKYAFNKTAKVAIEYFEGSMFCDIAKKITESPAFKFVTHKLRIFAISDGKPSIIFKPNDRIHKYRGNEYIFCTSMDYDPKYNDEKSFLAPLYLGSDFKDEETVSAYPRMVTLNEQMTIEDLGKKIFMFARKYMDIGDFEKFKEDYDKLVENEKGSGLLEKFEQQGKNEFEEMFYKGEEGKFKDVLNDLPFEFFLKKDDKRKYIIRRKDTPIEGNYEALTALEGYNNKDTVITELIDLFRDGWEFCLEINFKSKFYTNKLAKSFNTCLPSSEIQKLEGHKNDIYSCFERFTETEQLDQENEWYCKKCKKLQQAYKQLEIFYLPKLLIIHLKRFRSGRYYWDKNNSYVDFPVEGLDLKNFVTGPDKYSSVYDLYAVSQHYGGCGGGHYTAVAKNDGQWYSFNDSSVSRTDANDIKSSAAYVLFYRRKTD
ncbi:MAG: hypothetical protein MJ252_24395 [archaeon]|nr:hypothetical protein [archaeon]